MSQTTEPGQIDLLITGVDIVTMDPARTVVRDGAIAVQAGRIAWLGPSDAARSRYAGAETIAGRGRIALPGLLDTHFHTGQQLLRGKISELGKRKYLRLPVWRNYLVPFESCLDEEDLYLSALLAYTNMIRVGTTCFGEAGGPHPDQMGRAAEEVGIRGFISRNTMDMGEGIPPSMLMTTRQAIEENAALVKRWRSRDNNGRVQAWLSLRQLIVCTQELWEAFRDLSTELGTRIHTHLAEGTYEVDYSAEQWGKRPAEHLESIGFLGTRMHAAHSILLSDKEVRLYEKYGVTATHCPNGNYLIGPPKVMDMWQRGIAIGLGSDGASGGSIDLFRAAHVAYVGQQGHFGTPWHDRSVCTPEDILAIATNGGARALAIGDEVGSLEVGKKADLILANPADLDLQPVYDPAYTAARGIIGRDVETVIVDGKVVMKDREIVTVDEQAVRARIEARWPKIMERFEALVG